ncbi:MAG: GGDEF domain-containing protein, partial [Treponema sp.]|nr:GGDEF domain-containing protein [Treponema sp.]
MKNLDIKIAYLNDDFKIVDRNKEFYTYFETVGFVYTDIEDIVSPEHKEKFINFVKSKDNKDKFRVFRFKKITGEFLQNIVSVNEDILNGKKYRTLHIVTVISAVEFIKESLAYEKFTTYALGLTNEYIFIYRQSDHNFRMNNFMKDKNVVVYEQDIDSWKTQVLEDGLINKKDTVEFETKINELKECRPSFSMTVNSSLRFSQSMFENLVFKAVRTELDGETYMIGRMLPEIAIEQTQKSNEIIEELKIDSLTGTYNKKAILNFAQNRFVEGTKADAMLAIVDLDHFKPVNDAYGHLAGDKVLAKAGGILKRIVGDNGIVGRYGGDEFLLILEDMGEENVFRGLFRTICVDIESAFKDMFTDIKVTASVGAASYKKDGNNFDELFKKADFCLYRAKDKGRNRYVFFR